MPTLNLTTKFIDTVPVSADRTEYFDTQVKGMALRVSAGGRKTFVVIYRNADGIDRRLTLGTYPDLKLEQARKQAQSARGKVADGKDPVKDKQESKQKRTGKTVADLAKEYMAQHARVHKSKKAADEDQRMIDAEILTAWKDTLVTDLTRGDIRALLAGIAARAPIAANRYLSLIRKMLNFAITIDWLEANPCALMVQPGKETARERVLTDDEVRAFWLACEQERPAMCVLTRLRLVSAQRGVELENIRWDDLDLKDPANSWWTVPSEIAKNGQMHRVPLTKRALALIALMPKLDGIDYVFPGRIGNGVVNKPCGDARKAALRIAKAAGLGNVWGRDLRRTASTNMAKAGVPQPDIAKILNHQEDGPRATSVYNRYAYDKEKRAALNTWERALARILKTKTTPHA